MCGFVCQPRIGKARERNEGIILRRNDQSGYANSIRELQSAGAVIVIAGIAEAAVSGGDFIVEFPQRFYEDHWIESYSPGNALAFRRIRFFKLRTKWSW